MRRVREHIKPEMVPEHAQKKTKSDFETDTSPHDGERIPQVHLAPFTEIIGEVNEVDSSNDEVRLVLTSSKTFSIIIPRQQIARESTLPKPDEFVSILRTDEGYKILTHARVSRGARHKSPTSERGDIEC
jgi:hypothetical protein